MNMMLTGTHMGFILFIIIMGFMKGSLKNFTKPLDPTKNPSGFIPYGVSGVFAGASMVYLSYIGYDTVSTMAEEVEDPVHDIPIGVSGSVVLVTLLYCLMAASISMLVPYDTVSLFSLKWINHNFILHAVSFIYKIFIKLKIKYLYIHLII